MKKEKSCGAVIYKIENRIIKYLILHMGLGHNSLCKGHVEENESEEETAYREIKEETSLEVKIDINFRKVITYSPKENVIKDVVFFVAEVISKNSNGGFFLANKKELLFKQGERFKKNDVLAKNPNYFKGQDARNVTYSTGRLCNIAVLRLRLP